MTFIFVITGKTYYYKLLSGLSSIMHGFKFKFGLHETEKYRHDDTK